MSKFGTRKERKTILVLLSLAIVAASMQSLGQVEAGNDPATIVTTDIRATRPHREEIEKLVSDANNPDPAKSVPASEKLKRLSGDPVAFCWYNTADDSLQDAEARTIEIGRIVDDLYYGDRSVRARARNRLKIIGPRALLCLHNLPATATQAHHELTRELAVEIQDKQGAYPSRANGLDFLAQSDRIWRIPPPGLETPIHLGISVTNTRESVVRFEDLYLTVSLISPDGQRILGNWDGPWGCRTKGLNSPPLKYGEKYTGIGISATLHRSADGKDVWLEGKCCDLNFTFRDLKPGLYYLDISCTSLQSGAKANQSESEVTSWRGQTAIPAFVIVELR